jgi:cytochrome c-type biogenesis protein CcmF
VISLLIGIAASSSFQTNEDATLRPGESTIVDGREVTYVRPTADITPTYIELGGVLAVEEGGERVATLTPSRRYHRPTGQEGGTIGSFFNGEATSEVGLKAGFLEDLWASMQPDIGPLQRRVRAADRGFEACVGGAPGAPAACEGLAALMRAARAEPSLQPRALAQIQRLQSLAIDRIARSYLTDGSAAAFRMIVDPLVTWMWIGGLIALAGALIALWPSRGRRRGAVVRTEADALKEAKYREIRDAELDHAAGKLSDADFALLDAELRREAVEILDRVENGRSANGQSGGEKRPKVPQG